MRINNDVQILIAILIFVAIIIKTQIYDSAVLNSDPRFTVGRIYKIEGVVNGGPIARFEYWVNNKKFTNSFDIDADKKSTTKIGDTYLLKFKNGDPDLVNIDCQCEIPDSIVNHIPVNGWKKRPKGYCTSKRK